MMKENPGIGVGLHLNLTSGKPLTNCPLLTNPETGLFYKGRVEMLKNHPVMRKVENEWNAQMNKYIELLGELPDHIDSHHYVHVGIVDLDLYRLSSYNIQRIKELDILCSDTVKQYIEEHHIELTNYSE